MKPTSEFLNDHRLRVGRLGSDESFGNSGCFYLPFSAQVALQVIASDGMGWDHVSVVAVDPRRHKKLYRLPTWTEMCWVKDHFFGADEAVFQFHPPKKVYRNAHEYCLHLWKPQDAAIPLPDPIMVAPEYLRLPV